jgi:hypothetical protein
MRLKTKNKSTPLWLKCLGVGTAAGALAMGIQPAAADNGPSVSGEICMQKTFGTPVTNANKLNCTANDIRLSKAISVSQETCTLGTTFDLTATFETVVTANARYDAGFFFRTDGGPNARGDGSGATGECSLSALTIPPPPNPPALNLDGDTCGDLNSGTYNVTFTIPDVLCQDNDNNGFLDLPNCTSWHSNQGTACNIEDPDFDITDAVDFHPDTKSKCVCDDTFQVPVRVQQATINVEKTAAPTQVPEPGGDITYTVKITNSSTIVSVTIDSIIDDPYGNIGTNAPGFTHNTCPDLIGDTLAADAFVTCEFTAPVSGNSGDRVTDEVEGCVLQPSDNNKKICANDTADVDITDVFTEPTLQKTAQATANCQLDATYQVVVSNNSEIDTLTVNTLNDDKFGSITQTHAASGGFGQVVSTTCSVPQTVNTQGNYTCSFVGRIVEADCEIDHTNKVTGNVTDDDGVISTPDDTATVTATTTP